MSFFIIHYFRLLKKDPEQEETVQNYVKVIDKYCEDLAKARVELLKEQGQLENFRSAQSVPKDKVLLFFNFLFWDGFPNEDRVRVAELCIENSQRNRKVVNIL